MKLGAEGEEGVAKECHSTQSKNIQKQLVAISKTIAMAEGLPSFHKEGVTEDSALTIPGEDNETFVMFMLNINLSH